MVEIVLTSITLSSLDAQFANSQNLKSKSYQVRMIPSFGNTSVMSGVRCFLEGHSF